MIIAIRGMQKQPPSLSRSRHNYIPWACACLRAQGHAVEVEAEAMAEIELRLRRGNGRADNSRRTRDDNRRDGKVISSAAGRPSTDKFPARLLGSDKIRATPPPAWQ